MIYHFGLSPTNTNQWIHGSTFPDKSLELLDLVVVHHLTVVISRGCMLEQVEKTE